MDWSGIGGGVWSVRIRELEHFVRGLLHVRRRDPEGELPDAELPDGEQRTAVRQEAARRMMRERR